MPFHRLSELLNLDPELEPHLCVEVPENDLQVAFLSLLAYRTIPLSLSL